MARWMMDGDDVDDDANDDDMMCGRIIQLIKGSGEWTRALRAIYMDGQSYVTDGKYMLMGGRLDRR